MKKLNVVIVYNPGESQVLMCKRSKEPYKGMMNFVGGKVEQGESEIDAAYRELFEESGISKQDIRLTHIMNFQYFISGLELEVFAGKLSHEVTLKEEINSLFWVDRNENFCDMNRFAGECNIEHMLQQVDYYKDRIFQEKRRF